MDSDNIRLTEEEQQAIVNKLFDCTESPIKEWIASYFNVPVEEVFCDFVDDSDVIGFQEGSIHYNAYVVTLSSESKKHVDEELIKHSEKTRKACSMLYDGVYKSFAAIIQTASEKYKDFVANLRPIFDEHTMSFKLVYINGKAAQLKIAIDQRNTIFKTLNNEQTTLTEQQKQDIGKILTTVESIIKQNTIEVLNEEELYCVEINNKLDNYDKLFIVVENAEDAYEENLETSLSRMPDFGIQYQDPDEETCIDKLKKEYDVL